MSLDSLARFGVCLLLTGAPSLALAQVAPPAAPGEQAASVATDAAKAPAAARHYNGAEIVCRYTSVTGTRFPIRACQSRADWEQLALDSRDALDHAQMGFGKCSTGNKC